MAKGLWFRMALIVLCRMAVLAGTAGFARTVSNFLGSMVNPLMTREVFSGAVLAAFYNALLILAGEALLGQTEYWCTAKARVSLRDQIFSKILLLDVGNAEKTGGTGAVLAAAAEGVEAMQLYYSRYLPGLGYCFLAPLYLFWRLKDASFPAAVFLLTVTILLVPANNLFRGIVAKLKDSYWGSFRDLTAYYLESLQNLTTIKLFNQDERRQGILKSKADDFNRRIMEVMRLNFRSFLFSDAVIYVSVGIAVIITGRQLLAGTIDLSAALMVLMLSYGFFASVRQLMNTTHQALTGIAAAQNISALLDLESERPSLPYQVHPEADGFTGIRLRNIDFSYSGRNGVVNNLSLDIERGKVTALVGRSGCGKSTIAGLLMRFFDPAVQEKSSIAIDGVDYRCFSPDELRKQISMVPQQVGIFSGTIAENLRVAKPDAADDELWDVLSQARLNDWVRSHPGGLNADTGDGGVKLSGGQRQKIGIARVLLSGAPYLIFDEATSSVDTESEQDIWACIAGLAKTRTLIIISHRLSTIRDADTIYVLEKGMVAEKGNHRELLEQGGIYRNLVEEQNILEKFGAGEGR
ncbi:MAG: ATP-binding cassette domain-containing protein [Treponema sp.]|nr:ATP-binding cassette domain-containing protein [Treponema sp.]